MSGTTVSGSYATGIILTNGAYNPVSVTGTITTASGIALNGEGGIVWTVTNAGQIDGGAIGVLLAGGGGVTNQAGGTITADGASGYGIELATSVTNDGLIGGNGYGVLNGSAVYNQAGGTITGGKGGVRLSGGSLTNAGTIAAYGSYGTGVFLRADAVVTNQAMGVVSATAIGINASDVGTVVNYGVVEAGNYGVARAASVTNQAGGTITGAKAGVNLAVSVTNAGIIEGTGAYSTGIVLQSGGYISNAATGTISGGDFGINASGGGATVVNDGFIGGALDAIAFAANATNRLVVDPRATFSGTVYGGYSANSTLELAGSSAGVISGLGSEYIDFTQIVVDTGSDWTLAGSNTVGAGVMLGGGATITLVAGATLEIGGTVAAGMTIAFAGNSGTLIVDSSASMAGAVAGFAPGDTIDLAGVDPASVSYGSGALDYTSSGSGTSFALDAIGGVQAVSDGAGGTDVIALACFAEGTMIATPGGGVTVEQLRPGTMVLTAAGVARPVRWVGYRRLDLTSHPAPETVRPFRVRAWAIGDNAPCRDLMLSPDHAVYLNGMLMPIRLLANGASIAQDTVCRAVTYYHVELDSHDILLAENLAVESYLDTGNRGMFENAEAPLVLHPDFTDDQARRTAESCAPFITDAVRLEPLWRDLATRAVDRGWSLPPPPPATDDPALRVIVGNHRIKPVSAEGDRYVFMLPATAGPLRLVSRSMVPGRMLPWVEDRRRLGVRVAKLTLRMRDAVETIPLDHPSLCDGWWQVEDATMAPCRWTNGNAVLPLRCKEAAMLEIVLLGEATYPLDEALSEDRPPSGRLAA